MSYRVGVDVGGTFTDMVVMDTEGNLGIFKVPSRPKEPEKAVLDAFVLAAASGSQPLEDFLGKCEFVHGTTIATNAVLERKAAKTGLICTEGFRDILTLGQGRKPDTYNLRMHPPKPYVPRYLTLPVRERINSEGEVVIPLNEDDARKAVRQFKAWNVQAIAVCFLWSIANPVHEQQVAQIIESEWPGIPYSISSEVQPIIREYLRTSATSLDASLKPVVRKYLANLETSLKSSGLKSEVLVAVSAGGVMSAKQLAQKPIYSVLSGPSSGPNAGLLLAQQVSEDNLITIDMGGTSFEVSVVTKGYPAVTRAAKVGGVATGITTVEVSTIGAGGGSIGWVDEAGMLHVGPQSAGADPGPACYMKGGTEPTVTDANVVLGYINPDYFLGGRIQINAQRSEEVIRQKIADALQISTVEAAEAIHKVVNQNMIGAIEQITIRRGVDPREYMLIVGGGAGAVHAARLAQELQMKRVLIPRVAGVLCALGMLASDITFENVGSLGTTSNEFDVTGVNQLLADQTERGTAALIAEGVPEKDRIFEYFVDARYPGQTNETSVTMRSGQLTPEAVAQLAADFHETHQNTYGSSEPGAIVEFGHWRVVARGRVEKLKLPEHKSTHAAKDPAPALKGKRQAYFDGQYLDTAVYDGDKVEAGNVILGPAIIEEATTTVIVTPAAKITVTQRGDYFMELG